MPREKDRSTATGNMCKTLVKFGREVFQFCKWIDRQREKQTYSKYRARQLYKNISMLFLFPVKDGKLSTGVIATFNASCYG